MKLSKKLIAALLTAALVIAQVSVLPFAEAGTESPYASGYDDGAYYFWRVPNTQSNGNALPKNSAGRTYANKDSFGVSEFNPNIARDVETLEYKKAGSIFIEEFDGERFADITPTSSCGNFNLCSQAYYNGSKYYPSAGVPSDIDASKIEAFAIRFKVTGEGDSGFELRIGDESSPFFGFVKSVPRFTYIDAKTNEVSTITYGDPNFGEYTKSYHINGEMDGWIIVPLTLILKDKDTTTYYTAEEGAAWLREKWKSVHIYAHHKSCKHGAGFSDWADRRFYVGDSLFLTDVDKFIDVHGAPEAPECLKRTYNSITVDAIKGNVYSIAKASAPETILATNETGVFKDLEEYTEYTIFASWKDGHNAYTSQRTYITDQSNPSLEAPEYIEGTLTDEGVKIKVIPGLEYAINGSATYSETGIFTGFAPDTEYQIIGRNKVTFQPTAVLTIKTLALENIYDRGDGSSSYFEVPRDATTYKGSTISGAFVKNAEGGLNIVDINGDKFVEVKTKEGEPGGNISASGKAMYGMSLGFPRNIWVENFYGFALRVKVEGEDNMQIYLQSNLPAAKKLPGGTYYLIDSETGTWTKELKTDNFKFTNFNGWIILPFSTMYLRMQGVDYSTLQNEMKNLNYYLRGGKTYGTPAWGNEGNVFYMGDIVVVEDIEKFISVYAPNTTTPITPPPRNDTTDTSIPAVMMNNASGNQVGDGLYSLDRVRAHIVTIKKPNEESQALRVSPSYGATSVLLQNDALNYDVVTQELEWKVLGSLGIAFYLEVPDTLNNRVHFGIRVKESVTEYHNFGSLYYYYTVSEGVALKRYGALEFKPGFKGYVMLPFNHFDLDTTLSEPVDGLLNNPDSIDAVGLTFDADTYPEMAFSHLFVDDFMLYQDDEAFITAILKHQGTDEFSIVDYEKSFRLDDYPEIPRLMANDCTGIELEDGIYAIENLELALVDKKGSEDSYINITISEKKFSSVLFENHAYYDDISAEDLANLYNSKGVSFKLTVPENALMTVGMDMEIFECEFEYFLYDPNTYYYTVADGVVTQVYGYLEFNPGFDGVVVIPFENFTFAGNAGSDEEVDYYDPYDALFDRNLTEIDLIDYFGFYFSTDYYASIANTTISIDDIAFYGETMEYIDAVWASQTKGGTIIPDSKPGTSIEGGVDKSPTTGEATPLVAVAGLVALSAAAVAFCRKRKED
ncbi:MAG: hypothetical protein UHH95_03775 [Oscillospiraceae bacterium]|nr:hypothetical protein [Oscillospiraceae bacterium]